MLRKVSQSIRKKKKYFKLFWKSSSTLRSWRKKCDVWAAVDVGVPRVNSSRNSLACEANDFRFDRARITSSQIIRFVLRRITCEGKLETRICIVVPSRSRYKLIQSAWKLSWKVLFVLDIYFFYRIWEMRCSRIELWE